MPLIDRAADAVETDVLREQLAQRRVVEQRRRIARTRPPRMAAVSQCALVFSIVQSSER
jgi:hypothetical protein